MKIYLSGPFIRTILLSYRRVKASRGSFHGGTLRLKPRGTFQACARRRPGKPSSFSASATALTVRPLQSTKASFFSLSKTSLVTTETVCHDVHQAALLAVLLLLLAWHEAGAVVVDVARHVAPVDRGAAGRWVLLHGGHAKNN